MEILDATTEDVAKIKKHCWVELIVGGKIYWRAPASVLMLEEWLHKALMKIRKGKGRRIEKYLHQSRVLSLGGLSPTTIDHQQRFFLRVCADEVFTLDGDLILQLFIEGLEFRPVS
jgi:hypothetical protein